MKLIMKLKKILKLDLEDLLSCTMVIKKNNFNNRQCSKNSKTNKFTKLFYLFITNLGEKNEKNYIKLFKKV